MNLDTLTFTVTAPGAGAAMAAVTNDPSTIRNGSIGSQIRMIGMWTKSFAVGTTQIVWPSGHDLVRGFRYRNIVAGVTNKVPRGCLSSFRAQDPLTLTQAGSGTAGNIESAQCLFWYEDLPGVDAHLIDLPTLNNLAVNILTIEDTITPTVAGQYSGARALNAASDLLKANTNYAIVGCQVGVACGGITVRGVDFGGLRIAFPGDPNIDPTAAANFYVDISESYDLPCIPVFNSANRAGTFVEVVQDQNLTAVPFSLFLVELSAEPLATYADATNGGSQATPTPTVTPVKSNLGAYLHPKKA